MKEIVFGGVCVSEDRKAEERDWGPTNMDTFTGER